MRCQPATHAIIMLSVVLLGGHPAHARPPKPTKNVSAPPARQEEARDARAVSAPPARHEEARAARAVSAPQPRQARKPRDERPNPLPGDKRPAAPAANEFLKSLSEPLPRIEAQNDIEQVLADLTGGVGTWASDHVTIDDVVKRRLLVAFDADNDGRIAGREYYVLDRAIWKQHAGSSISLRRQFDADGNARLGKDELAAVGDAHARYVRHVVAQLHAGPRPNVDAAGKKDEGERASLTASPAPAADQSPRTKSAE